MTLPSLHLAVNWLVFLPRDAMPARYYAVIMCLSDGCLSDGLPVHRFVTSRSFSRWLNVGSCPEILVVCCERPRRKSNGVNWGAN